MRTRTGSLQVLFDRADLPTYELPAVLERRYGGRLGFDPPRVVANFVSSLDGVVALPGVPHSSQTISDHSGWDRFVMGLLRACADAVLIGAGTLRGAPGSLWTPDFIDPDDASAFAELRARLGRDPEPRLAVVSARGEVDAGHAAFEDGALVLTTASGAARLRGRLPSASTVVALADGGSLDLREVVGVLRGEGHALVLSEGGPTVTGGLLESGVLDELFLTLSPLLAGRSSDHERPGLVEGLELLPARTVLGELAGIRRGGSHLFLRYLIAQRPGGE